MEKSKYNPKLDPKYNAKQSATAPASVQVSATAPTVVKIHSAMPADVKDLTDKSVEAVVAPVATVQAATSLDAKGSADMVSEGGPTPANNPPHVVREPSTLTGEPVSMPVVPVVGEPGEQATTLLATPHA